MQRKGADEWLQDLAEEEPDAAHLAITAVRPDDAAVPEWAETHWQAWHSLRFDRQYGAFGGETPISFVALDTYAQRYGIVGVEYSTFLILVGAIDDEYLAIAAERAKAEKSAEDQREQRENS